MDRDLEHWLKESLASVPLEKTANSRVLVGDSIEFRSPERIPYSLINPVRSDFFELAAMQWRQRSLRRADGTAYHDEWLIKRKRIDGLFDQAIEFPLENLEELNRYSFPRLSCLDSIEYSREALNSAFNAGKYVLGHDPVNLYDRVVSLAGFETALLAPYKHPQELEFLLDRLTEITLLQIEEYAATNLVQGFMTWQDFGNQNNLVMSPKIFRQFYQPRLQKMIDLAHAYRMHFIWHCCGSIYELLPMMIEMGVDVVQLDQPKLIGYHKLAQAFGGKICFWNTLDTLWSTQEKRTESEVMAEISAMFQAMAGFDGGLMYRHYPQQQDIGLPIHLQNAIAKSFSSSNQPRACESSAGAVERSSALLPGAVDAAS